MESPYTELSFEAQHRYFMTARPEELIPEAKSPLPELVALQLLSQISLNFTENCVTRNKVEEAAMSAHSGFDFFTSDIMDVIDANDEAVRRMQDLTGRILPDRAILIQPNGINNAVYQFVFSQIDLKSLNRRISHFGSEGQQAYDATMERILGLYTYMTASVYHRSSHPLNKSN